MSEHKATITWQRSTPDFEYKTYSRNHRWKFSHGVEIEGSAAPNYLGDTTKVDPEEALVASLSSCHMLTFLAVCAMKKLTVDHYEDQAIGFLEKNAEGKLAITRVDLHPQVTFGSGISVSEEELEKLHDKAHHECFIANSVKTEVRTVI